MEEFPVSKVASGSGGSGTLTFPLPQHRLNVGLLQLLRNNRSVRQEGWLSPTKRASAAKIN